MKAEHKHNRADCNQRQTDKSEEKQLGHTGVGVSEYSKEVHKCHDSAHKPDCKHRSAADFQFLFQTFVPSLFFGNLFRRAFFVISFCHFSRPPCHKILYTSVIFGIKNINSGTVTTNAKNLFQTNYRFCPVAKIVVRRISTCTAVFTVPALALCHLLPKLSRVRREHT